MEGVLRKKIYIDETTGKPVELLQQLDMLFKKNTTRSDIIKYFESRAKIINDMDD